MNEFMKILLSLSVSGALLLLLIFVLKPLYKNKFSRHWQYYIWIIVALRFLLPFTPDTTIVGSLFEKFDTAAVTSEISTIQNAPVPENTDNDETAPVQINKDIHTVAMREPFNRYVCLFFIWSTLALVLFVRRITVYQGFIQYINAGNTEISDIKILNLLSDCQEKLNIRTRVELSHNSLIASPMLIGFFRPRIILPVGKLVDKELSYIFVHELIHYKQRDMFYKWLIQIVVCVHWFNPFVYLLEKEVNKSCELSCDEKVISILDDKARREYGNTLISFLKSDNLYKNSLASVTLTEGAEQLKERLGAIMELKKKSKAIKALTALFTCMFCICFAVAGAYAAASQPEEKEKQEHRIEEQEVSVRDDENYKSVYTQNGYFYDSYIIEMGWNVYGDEYPDQTELVLQDGSVMKVYFADTSKNYIADNNAIAAASGLLSYLKNINTYPTIEIPLITRIIYTGNKDMSALREEFYQNGYVCGFSALFSLLNETEQKKWYQKIYDTDKVAFFSAVTEYMDNDLIAVYVDKAEQDNKVNFFATLLDYMQSSDLKHYAEKSYDADNIACFAILLDYMTKEDKQEWLIKAQTDKKNNFAAVLSDD